eukprot:COSAG06_NODE_18676_length_874_cov_1.305806_1_plen_179_part_10
MRARAYYYAAWTRAGNAFLLCAALCIGASRRAEGPVLASALNSFSPPYRMVQPLLLLLLLLLQSGSRPAVPTLFDPHLTLVRTIVDDPHGHVRDCAPPLQDRQTGHWHMWCNWVSITAPSQSCWNCTVRHYYLNTSDLADASAEWQDRGTAVRASEPWDSAGAWAPGAIEEGGVWSLFY